MEKRAFEPKDIASNAAAHDPVSIASNLWKTLERLQTQLNILSRSQPRRTISPNIVDLVNSTLSQVQRLLREHGYAEGLLLIDPNNPPTHTDTLIIIGNYKRALKAFRVGVLGEGQYTF